jgi:SAM-dependent methyltransferase
LSEINGIQAFDEKMYRIIQNYFSETLTKHGATAKGADWRDDHAQQLRFVELSRILSTSENEHFTVTDFGCGTGAFSDFLVKEKFNFSYLGIDCTRLMIETARNINSNKANCRFEEATCLSSPTDFTVVSGTFNYKGMTPFSQWQDYVLDTLGNIDRFSTRGFAFNLLTSYSDEDKMLDHLYYPEPAFYFDFCKRNFSRNVALLHDYGAYEFTILVRKQ